MACAYPAREISPEPTRVTFSAVVLNNWAWAFRFWRTTEWAFCLNGYRDATTLRVESEQLALIHSAGLKRVYFDCPTTAIGSVHSHPLFDDQPHCSFSDEDVRRAYYDRELMVVVCTDSTFVLRRPFWPRDSLIAGRMPPVRKVAP